MLCKSEQEGKTTINGVERTYRYPCGQCLHCRINKRNQWSGRILLESLDHPYSYFVTLSYDPRHPIIEEITLPSGELTVCKSHLQNFIKRFRRYSGEKISYYGCGEYGEKRGRPHYHVVIFTSIEPNQFQKEVEKAWTIKKMSENMIGFVSCSLLNSERAQYVAQYTTKKLMSGQKYSGGRVSEFALMSKNPSIGRGQIMRMARAFARYNKISQKLCHGEEGMELGQMEDIEEKVIEASGKGVFRLNGNIWPLDRYAKKLIISEVQKATGREINVIADQLSRDLIEVYNPDSGIAMGYIENYAEKAEISSKKARRFIARRKAQKNSEF